MGKDALPKKRMERLMDAEKLQKITRSRKFSTPTPNPKILTKNKFFIFRWPGDEIEGILGPPIRNYRRNTSYTLEQRDGTLIEFFGNKLVHNIIDKNDLQGAYVRIVYVGLLDIQGLSRMQKIYEIYKVEGWDLEVPQHSKQKGD